MEPEITLITATLGRDDELIQLFNSLKVQTFKNFELIIIDQNNRDNVKKIVANFKDKINITYIRSSVKGLSVNRNMGLGYARGKIYGFPDDDCYYTPDILENVHRCMLNESIKYVCFNVFDINKVDFCWKRISTGKLKRKNIFYNCISFNFFIRANNIKFDEKLGIGAKFGSGEETDYLFENIARSDIGVGINQGRIFHNFNTAMWNEEMIRKNYKYCEGFGAVCKKDIRYRYSIDSIFLYLKYLIRPFIGLLIKPNKKIYLTSIKGRIKGFIEYTY